YHRVFCFPIEEYYRRLGLLDVDDYPTLAAEWVKEYRAKEDSLPAREDAKALLARISQLGIKQSILSASETEMLKKQLRCLGITSYFTEILGRKDYYATDKSDIAIAFRKANPNAKVLMIGDTDHDLKAAQVANFDCALVAGGHQSFAYLKSICPNAFADFSDLERVLFE
ncbi:MAG: HAD family hydrolase, partial [Clostridia bacterium]|nr:HAD family hydrolase [Clostridia bacterium]